MDQEAGDDEYYNEDNDGLQDIHDDLNRILDRERKDREASLPVLQKAESGPELIFESRSAED